LLEETEALEAVRSPGYVAAAVVVAAAAADT